MFSFSVRKRLIVGVHLAYLFAIVGSVGAVGITVGFVVVSVVTVLGIAVVLFAAFWNWNANGLPDSLSCRRACNSCCLFWFSCNLFKSSLLVFRYSSSDSNPGLFCQKTVVSWRRSCNFWVSSWSSCCWICSGNNSFLGRKTRAFVSQVHSCCRPSADLLLPTRDDDILILFAPLNSSSFCTTFCRPDFGKRKTRLLRDALKFITEFSWKIPRDFLRIRFFRE